MNKNQILMENIFNGKFSHLIFISLLFIIIGATFFEIAFKNKVPQAPDTMQWRSSAQCMIEYNDDNKNQALWDSNVFSGMPGYLISFSSKYPFINSLLKFTSSLMNWRIFLLFTAAVGIYFFMIFLGFEPIIAFFSGISFALSCHFLGLLEIGHNTKFRAIMFIPWILYSIHYLKERKSILAIGLATLFLIGQLRENHPQITYYTLIMIGIYWIFQLVFSIKKREIKKQIIFSFMLLGVILISLLAIAHPYLSTLEYSEFTIRGGAEGVGKSYATSWSFHPAEMITFIIPNFFGGISPNYWGWMPFTQTSMYFGVIILALAVIAIIFNRSQFVKILMTVSIVSLLISFGKHFSALSNLLLNYLPFFNKFRVPAMILILLQFSAVILAGFGLKTIINFSKEKNEKLVIAMKYAFIGVIILGLIFVVAEEIFKNLNFVNELEKAKIKKQYVEAYGKINSMEYATRHIQNLKQKRLNLLMNDGYIAFGFLLLFFGITFAFTKKKISKYPFIFAVIAISVFDLINVDQRFLQKLYPQNTLNASYKKTAADNFLLNDKDTFRIYPLGAEFGQNRWSYYHQTIGGYHAVKLQRYEDIIANCLNVEIENRIPINWNIVNMLNVKYVIFGNNLPLENLEYADYDREQKLTIYKNKEYLPRAWFVQKTEFIKGKNKIWKRMNQKEFDPSKMAITEEKINNISAPKNTKVELFNSDLHTLEFRVETDTTAFLTISEIYYPKGWKAFIDGFETKIYPTNYILRGVVIPSGKHLLELKFEPEIYRFSLKLSSIGLIISVLLILVGLYFYYRKNYQGKIVYTVKK